jgi:hypothetical protein
MFRARQFIHPCGCRSAGECFHNLLGGEPQALEALVDEFSSEMKKKLIQKYLRDGYTGWDDPGNRGVILEKLRDHVDRLVAGEPQEIDVANLAAMLWNFRQGKEGP